MAVVPLERKPLTFAERTYLPQIAGTIKFRLNNKDPVVRAQAAALAVADVDHRQQEARRLEDAARAVADHHLRLRQQRPVAHRAQVAGQGEARVALVDRRQRAVDRRA